MALLVLSYMVASSPVWIRVSAAVCLIGVVAMTESGVLRVRWPNPGGVVPQAILARPPFIAGWQFGNRMGSGYRTLSPTGRPLMAAATFVLVGTTVWSAASLALGFAIARASVPAFEIWPRYGRASRPVFDLLSGIRVGTAILLGVAVLGA